MKKVLTIIAGCILLFVVVCPITPTPIAVPGGKSQSVQAPVMVVVAIALLTPVYSERSLWNAVSFEIPGTSSGEVVDLTCARLC